MALVMCDSSVASASQSNEMLHVLYLNRDFVRTRAPVRHPWTQGLDPGSRTISRDVYLASSSSMMY